MKAEITAGGYLRLHRGTMGLRFQVCPFRHPAQDYGSRYCGIWCPLFTEPQYSHDFVTLSLCHKTISFLQTDFEDRR
jgi:hypothetical protein